MSKDGMTWTPGDGEASLVRQIARRRREWYDEPVGGSVTVPSPELPLPSQAASYRDRMATKNSDGVAVGCLGLMVAVIYGTIFAIQAWRRDEGRTALLIAGGALVCLWGVVTIVRRMASRLPDRDLPTRVARPWQDFIEAAVPDSDEPFNSSWATFAAREQDVRAAATGLWREHGDEADRQRWRETLWDAGSEAYAQREAARRMTALLAAETGVAQSPRSLVEALPPLTAALPEAATETVDTAIEAAGVVTTQLPEGLTWPDFQRLTAARQRHYAQQDWAQVDAKTRASNPRQAGWWEAAAPRRERLSRLNDLGTKVVAGLVLALMLATVVTVPISLWLSAACAFGIVGAFGLAVWLLPGWDEREATVEMPAWLAVPWSDFVAAMRYLTSGASAVPSWSAVAGSEARVRACATLLLDDSDPTLEKPLQAQDRVAIRQELERLCAQAWALREVEERTDDTIDEIADRIGPDDGGALD